MSNGSMLSNIHGLLKSITIIAVLHSTGQTMRVSEAQGYAVRQQSSGLLDAGLRYHLSLYLPIPMPVGCSFKS